LDANKWSAALSVGPVAGVASGERPARPLSTSTDRPTRESVEEAYIRTRAPMVRLAYLLTGPVDDEEVNSDEIVVCIPGL
jgi:hypothetical protein